KLGSHWAAQILEQDRARFAAELERMRADYHHEHQMLQADLDRGIRVGQVQFETEYRALVEAWGKLAALRDAMGALAQAGVPADPEAIQGCGEALDDFAVAIDAQGPFLPVEIFDELCAVRMVASDEAVELRSAARGAAPSQTQRRFEDFLKYAERTSTAIRAYLQALRIRK